MKKYLLLSIVILALLSGCATQMTYPKPVTLNKTENLQPRTNFLPSVSISDTVLVEIQEISNIEIAMRTSYAYTPNKGWIIAMFMQFHNKNNDFLELAPKIYIVDSLGNNVQAFTFENFTREFYTIQNRPIPNINIPNKPIDFSGPDVATFGSETTHHRGTVNDNYGNSATYSGTSTTSSGYKPVKVKPVDFGGAELGAAIAANIARKRLIRQQNEAKQTTDFFERSWLRNHIELPPNSSAGGILMFNPQGVKLPLKIIIMLGKERFEFLTIEQLPNTN